ncbi:MAG: hypothetical protein HAW63_02880 [Bdellovibrionaceae bacterium]|nr:hypothetical protein [Pseudobdellovibrionaceae bacterium]
MKQNATKIIKNKKGSAIVETLPLVIIFMTILGNMWGFFMAVHSGILSSIGARTYAFETFRNRADLTYFRDQELATGNPYKESINYYKTGVRIHGVTQPSRTNNVANFYPLSINYNKFSPSQAKASNSIQEQHRHSFIFSESREKTTGVKEIWIRSIYGMCLNFSDCS